MLLPGAGLGRLCVEVAAAGFEAQGNEFSYFMLLTAAFLLNSTGAAEQWTVHPWVHLTCNNVTNEDQLRGVTVPDVLPSSITPPGMLSMCAGDFVVSERKGGENIGTAFTDVTEEVGQWPLPPGPCCRTCSACL